MDTIRTFFLQNWNTFFDFQKGQGRPPPTPPSKPVSFAEYASIYLNIPKYPWKWLNKLFWLCQGSEYAWSSFMFNRLLKMPWVLNMARLYMQGLYRVLNMPEYGLICPSNAWICIMSPSVSKHGWILLNVRNLELALSIILKERELVTRVKAYWA